MKTNKFLFLSLLFVTTFSTNVCFDQKEKPKKHTVKQLNKTRSL